MKSSSVRNASRVMYAMGIYTLVMSLFWIFLTEVVFVSDFLAFTGQSYADYLASLPNFAEICLLLKAIWFWVLMIIFFLIILILVITGARVIFRYSFIVSTNNRLAAIEFKVFGAYL